MANEITDPLVVTFSNEIQRPLGERISALQVVVDEWMTRYDGGVATAMTGNASGDTIADGQMEKGYSALSKNDMALMAAEMTELKAQLDSAGAMAAISKGNVRTSASWAP